jgi:hypothetical protein
MSATTAQTWTGQGELFIYRDNARFPAEFELQRKPDAPGKRGRWAGRFAVAPLTVLTPGRGIIYLPNGGEAEVMVEGFDVLTGRGDFFGIDPAPF